MNKSLVTGGAGFIGSHLVKRLLDRGDEVTVIDDLSSGKISNLPDSLNLKFCQASILDTETARLYQGIDKVFHLAALTRPQKSILEPRGTNLININGTLEVLVNSSNAHVKRLVFASSSSLYGEQPVYPSSESDAPIPMSPYALQKLMGEQYCKLFQDLYSLESNCMRFFNVYGPRMDPDGFYACVIPKFIKLLKGGKRVTIYGDGKQARDFTYIDDVIDAIILASESEASGEVFNVGLGNNCSINRLYELICKKLEIEREPDFGPATVEPSQTLADKNKGNILLGWEPKISLEEGLDKIINLYE